MKNILKKISFIFILLTISVTSISLAENEVANYDNEVVPISMDSDMPVDTTSPQEETTKNPQKNYFYAGVDDVNLTNPIVGDVFIVTAGTVNIDTTISGNAFICASSVNVFETASIQSSLFNVSSSLNIAGKVGTNIYNVSKDFSLKGIIENDLFSTSNTSDINGYIYGDANISAENITFSDNAYIENNLNYSSKEKANIPDNVVHGKTNYSLTNTDDDNSFDLNDFVSSIISFMILAIVIFIIAKWLNCKFINSSNLTKSLPKSLLYGLVGLIVIPILSILLLIYGVTMNLAFILMAIYFVLLLIASSVFIITLSKLLAEKLHEKFDNSSNILLTILSIAVLSIVYKILQLIPVLGVLVTFLFVIIGIGILIKNIIPTKEIKNS